MSQTFLGKSLVDTFVAQTDRLSEQVVYIFLPDGEEEGKVDLTYRELAARVRSTAANLKLHMSPGERALLTFSPGLEFIVAFLGCLCAGIIPVPAYPPRRNRRSERILSIACAAQPSYVLTTQDLLEQVQAQFQGDIFDHIKCLPIDLLQFGKAESWQQMNIGLDSVAFLQFTSGSTGNPKGVMVSHENLLHNLHQIELAFGNTPDSCGVIWLPPYHDMGLIGGILQPIFVSARAVLMPSVSFLQKPVRWLQAISNYRGTTSGGPNFAFDLCVDRISQEQKQKLDLSCWKLAFNGAEPIRSETLQRFAEAFSECGFRPEAFYPCYGLAEATLFVSGGSIEASPRLKCLLASQLEQNKIVLCEESDPDSQTLVSSGHVSPEQEVIIVNPASLEQCSRDEVGEIWIAGESVALGYWNCEAQTQETFQVRHSGNSNTFYLRTGDLGFLDQDGELFVTGRLKEIILIRGRNYYPQDIELVTERSHPALRKNSGAAFSVNVNDQERLVIVHEVERSHLRKLNVVEIARAVRAAVSEEFGVEVYNISLIKTGSLFRTSSGKIQRFRCRDEFLQQTLDVVGTDELYSGNEFVEPQTERQVALVDLFAEVLSIPSERIGIYDNFFELGGHSLLVTQLIARLRELYKVELPLEALFEFPYVAGLDEVLNRGQRTASILPAIVPASQTNSSYSLSYAQERLWFLHQLGRKAATYNNSATICISGAIKITALQKALDEIVNRHEVLRATFHNHNGTVLQRISSTLHFPLVVIESSELDISLSDWLEQEAQQPFDLESGPLLRTTLVRIGERESILAVTAHHIISDGWSLGVMAREMDSLYNSYSEGQPPSLPPLPVQYSDYAVWQRKLLQDGILAEQLSFWKQQLAGAPTLLKLPTDYPRPRAQSYRGRTHIVTLSSSFTEQVKGLAREQKVTLFMLLLTAFQLLLHRYSRQKDILVGTPIANRQHTELESLIGFFINTLVMRVRINENESVADFLQKVRQIALSAYSHQDIPFDKVVETLKPKRSLAYSPLFQVMFALQNTPKVPLELSGLNLSLQNREPATAKFDLVLSIEEVEEELVGSWSYNCDLFEENTIVQMAEHFQQVLKAMLEDPLQPVSKLSLLDDEMERHQLLIEQNKSTDSIKLQRVGSEREKELLESETYFPPRNEAELHMAQLWSELLDVSSVGVQDDFFEIGGHSMLAICLVDRIHQEFQVDLSLEDLLQILFQNPTISSLSRALQKTDNLGNYNSVLVPIQVEGKLLPLFCIHPIGGSVTCYSKLSHQLGRERPVYGLQSLGLMTQKSPLKEIEAMASLYLDEIYRVQPQGPYNLVGWSMGGVIAYEMAQQITRKGESISFLGLIDSYPFRVGNFQEVGSSQFYVKLIKDLTEQSETPLENLIEKLDNSHISLDEAFRIIQQYEPTLPSMLLERLWSVFKSNLEALFNYKAYPYDGPVLLIKSSDLANCMADLANGGWEKLVKGELRAYVIEGDHYSIMRESDQISKIKRFLEEKF